MNISITVNDSQVRALISRAPGQINVAMRQGMNDAVSYTLAVMKRYPAQRAGSMYKRTGTLGRSWSSRITGGGGSIQGLVGSNANIAPYNRRVQSRREQAAVHRGRWRTAEDVSEQERTTVVRMFEARLRAAGLER